jgi:uncharacterized membrane protein YbhN (UPF0104 family)
VRTKWKSAIGIALSVGLLVWTLRGVSLAAVWGELQRSNLPLFFASAVAATLIFPLRAVRWRIILEPVQAASPVGGVWGSSAFGGRVHNLVAARGGESAGA